MNAIFLNNDPEKIKDVYSPEICNTIKKYCHLHKTVICRRDLTKSEKILQSVSFVFSTWDIPILSTEEIKHFLPNVRAVFYAAGSVQNFALPYLDSGARIISGWQANAVPVAEYTTSVIILANKGFFRCGQQRNFPFIEAKKRAESYPGNYRTTVGLLGAGAIGRLVINLLKHHELNIKVYDPFLSAAEARALGVEKCEISNIFSNCQTISNHLANNEQTKNLLTGKYFNLMKSNAIFINTGRGAQVNEIDLIAALKKEPGRTAILDVTEPEPPHKESEFFSMPNIILTPHIAGSSGMEIQRLAEYVVTDFERMIKNQSLMYEVTKKMLATMA